MSRNKKRQRGPAKREEYTRDLEAKLATAIEERDTLAQQVIGLSQVVEYFANKLGPDHIWVVEAKGFLEGGQ